MINIFHDFENCIGMIPYSVMPVKVINQFILFPLEPEPYKILTEFVNVRIQALMICVLLLLENPFSKIVLVGIFEEQSPGSVMLTC